MGVNEKKIRREIWLCKVTGAFCAMGAAVVFGYGLYFQDSWITNKTMDYWKLQAFVLSLFCLAVGVACIILFGLCFLLQRQGEHTLFLKETLTAHNEKPVADVWK
jgi:hypothetical protein